MKKTLITIWVICVTVDSAFKGAETMIRIGQKVSELQKNKSS